MTTETEQTVEETGEQTRADLREMAVELDALQAQIDEWAALQRLLHQAWVAFALFRARLGPAESSLGADERQMLLQDWRLCQGKLDALTGFAEEIEHIGQPLRREGRELRGERWAVEILALQLSLEDVLKEENLSQASLLDLGGEFESACQRSLAWADDGMRVAGDQLRRLSARLSGGVS